MNECKRKDMTGGLSLKIGLVYLILISNILFKFSSADVIKCSASNNERWSAAKQKCVQCKKCLAGHFRNSSETYTRRMGEHGPEQCLRCKPCPSGTYSKNGYGECNKCRVNCTKLDREYYEPCTRYADAKCGSCLSGFEDSFKSTKAPCVPRKSPRILIPPRKRVDETQGIQTGDSAKNTKLQIDQVADGVTTDIVSKSSRKKMSTELPTPLAVIIVLSSGIVLFVVGAITVRVVIQRRNLTRQSLALNNQGEYTKVDLSQDNDIEVDANAHHDKTVPKEYHQLPQTEFSLVRPELSDQQQPAPRPERTIPLPTDNMEGLSYLGFSDSTHCYVYKKYNDVCQCREERSCSCKSYTYPSTLTIEKSDKYVLEVAANVCHDPIPLVQDLGLGNPIIYQENDTRNRDPERISQKELVVNFLNRWIEVKSSPVTLQQLSKSLCKSNFHSINDKLYNLYCKDISSQTQ